jgi:hypothetical protein
LKELNVDKKESNLPEEKNLIERKNAIKQSVEAMNESMKHVQEVDVQHELDSEIEELFSKKIERIFD